MKKADAHHGQRVHFEHLGKKHTATVLDTNKADVEQVDVHQIEPPVFEGTLTKRASDLTPVDATAQAQTPVKAADGDTGTTKGAQSTKGTP